MKLFLFMMTLFFTLPLHGSDCKSLVNMSGRSVQMGPISTSLRFCKTQKDMVQLEVYYGLYPAKKVWETDKEYEKYLDALKLAKKELKRFTKIPTRCPHSISVEMSLKEKTEKFLACENHKSFIPVKKIQLLARYLHQKNIK